MKLHNFVLALFFFAVVHSHAFTIAFDSGDFTTSTQFNEVDTFSFAIDVDADLEPGVYENPDLMGVSYAVSGVLVEETPSGFPQFALERDIGGEEFYQQGSSLRFEIGADADLSDGLQFDELVGGEIAFVFNGREVDNGRYHPALLELNSDGTGRIQNSNNIHTDDPRIEVDFGDEYVTDLTFDPGNLTLVRVQNDDGGGGGALSSVFWWILLGMLVTRALLRQRGLRLSN